MEVYQVSKKRCTLSTVIVVSLLLALMKDQVVKKGTSLTQECVEKGVGVHKQLRI